MTIRRYNPFSSDPARLGSGTPGYDSRTGKLAKHGRPAFNQAHKIIARFGGPVPLAKALGISRIAVYLWTYRPPVGSDGIIPSRRVGDIMRVARAEGIILTDQDWLPERIDYSAQLQEEIFS